MFVWLVALSSLFALAKAQDVVGTASAECPCIDLWQGERAPCSSTYQPGQACENTNSSCRLSRRGYAVMLYTSCIFSQNTCYHAVPKRWSGHGVGAANAWRGTTAPRVARRGTASLPSTSSVYGSGALLIQTIATGRLARAPFSPTLTFRTAHAGFTQGQ